MKDLSKVPSFLAVSHDLKTGDFLNNQFLDKESYDPGTHDEKPNYRNFLEFGSDF